MKVFETSTFETLHRVTRFVVAVALLVIAAPLAAQAPASDPGVAVVNDSPWEVRIYAYEEDQGDRVLLGWVGSGELEFFSVPSEITSNEGQYRVAIQQVTPRPQLGETADHPILSTPVLEPEPDETVRVVIAPNLELTQVMVQ